MHCPDRNLRIARAVSILLALCLWEIGARLLAKPILLVGPIEVMGRLFSLMGDPGFFASIAFSFCRIIGGFLLAALIGIGLGIAAGHLPVLETLLWPYFSVMKAVPVASFVVLCLIWFRPRNLSVFISMVMVMPILYFNVLEGIRSLPADLIEMGRSFRFSVKNRFLLIELPALEPFLLSALKTALGVAWKAGIAAEIIGIPDGSIGERLYVAKIYLETGDLFAWTLVILCLSMVFEKLTLLAVRAFFVGYRKDRAGSRNRSGIADHAGSRDRSDNADHAVSRDRSDNADHAVSRDRATEVLSLEHIPTGRPVSVILKSVTAAYPEAPESPIFTDCTLAFPAGSISAVMGESGTGKTTLLRVIAGLLEPVAGEVAAISAEFEKDAKTAGFATGKLENEGKKTGAGSKSPSFGIVFQENRLCDIFSPVRNIEAALPRTGGSSVLSTPRIFSVLPHMGSRHRALTGFIESELALVGIPEEAMHAPVASHSGGMKRRCAIVRAMLSDGEVILLDEPFTGLDDETKRLAAEYIERRRGGRTVVMVTHSEEEARLLGARIIRV